MTLDNCERVNHDDDEGVMHVCDVMHITMPHVSWHNFLGFLCFVCLCERSMILPATTKGGAKHLPALSYYHINIGKGYILYFSYDFSTLFLKFYLDHKKYL
jgi:hypothetical protein